MTEPIVTAYDRLLAVRCAGSVVVALLLGIPIRRASMAGDEPYVEPTRRPGVSGADLACAALAADLAAARAGYVVTATDREVGRDQARQELAGVADREARLAREEAAAAALLERAWPMVEAVAKALCERRVLTYVSIMCLIRDTSAEMFRAVRAALRIA